VSGGGLNYVHWLERREANRPRLALIKLLHHRMMYGEECNMMGDWEEELCDMGFLGPDEPKLPHKGYWTASWGGSHTIDINSYPSAEYEMALEVKRQAEIDEAKRKREARYITAREKRWEDVDIAAAKRRSDGAALAKRLENTEHLHAVMKRRAHEKFLRYSVEYPFLYINAVNGRYMCCNCRQWGIHAIVAFANEHRLCTAVQNPVTMSEAYEALTKVNA
jgi:hypothetical protein